MLTFNNITADTFAADTQHGAGRRRPRHREALSCSQCRDRKVRCDRKQPCKQCQTRGLSSNCSYGTPREHGSFSSHAHQQQQLRKPHTAPPSPSSSTSGESDVRKRLDRLESLIAATASSAPPSESPGRGSSSIAADTPIYNNTASSLNFVQGSPLTAKTRFIGGTHWLAVCNNMIVLRAMLNKSCEFTASHKSFAEIKAWTKNVNSFPDQIISNSPENSGLRNLLPPRDACKKWIRTYGQTYRQVYDIVDEVTLESAIQSVWSQTETDNPGLISILLLVVCIGMQADETERLNGRRIARQVEIYAFTSNMLYKPCVSSMMILLLLNFVKTLACSDTESMDSLSGIVGLTNQVALAMGLHRDPASFGDIGPFHSEIRKRLWGIFFRMNFAYCMITGVPFSIREEDTTTGLPANVNLADIAFETDNQFPVKEIPQQTEATFSIIATKLAIIAAPYQRAICSATGAPSPDSIQRLGEQFKTLLATAPPHMRPGFKTSDPREEIQQAFITVTMHSMSLMVSLNFVLNSQPDPSQKAHLLNIWDHSLSVIHSFQALSSKTEHIQTVAYQLLWSEACRAAFSASMVLNRLRIIEMRSIMATRPQHTLIPFQESLMKYLTFMSRFWFRSAHLGPVASKNCLLLAVVVAVTAKLFAEDEGTSEQELIDVGARSVEQAVDSMKGAMQRRHGFPMSPEPSNASPHTSTALVRMISSHTDRSIPSPDASTTTWPSTSSVLENPSAPVPVPVPHSSATSMDAFAQSIGPMFGHPFMPSEGHSLSYNNEMAWPMEQYDFNTGSSISTLSINERGHSNGNPVFMDGLISPAPDWSTTSQWIDEMGMQYSNC